MANDVMVPGSFGAVSTVFGPPATKDALSEGIAAGYAIVGYKGKVWSIRYRGEEKKLIQPTGDPVSSIEAIILDAAPHTSKIYYEGGYQEGNQAPPDCFSNDGIKPDVSAPKIQNTICATCTKNAWGTATNNATGGKGKACGDFKRTAIVPLADPENDMFGGPMLLRIPAASLQEAATYGNSMNKIGYNTYMVGTRIGFDINESYPKFTFKGIRALSDEEAKIVVRLRADEQVKRILAEATIATETAVAGPTLQTMFEQPPVATPAPVAQPVAQPVQAAQPVQQTVTPSPVANGQAGVAVFGAKAETPVQPQPVAQPVQAAQPVVTPVVTTPIIEPTNEGPTAEQFEDALEARMRELMPQAVPVG